MRAMPDGWRCRVAGSLAPYDDLIGEVQVLHCGPEGGESP
jgi:hypothetical protein